ncbi:coiled-coil domain-containing protein 97 [Mugil cephalus]|uniref:coiled-coil domain-containing protein 97 n=1 Tax=Mugil cephalus TaxID=48193 RepID=UPI001FB78365|nr:coiled-coil domain-containing protein 97 [Mugil cephalus]
MIEAVVLSGRPVKSQQVGEDELSPDQRREELLVQYQRRPLVFLERYHTHLQPQHLSAFDHVSSDPRAQHYSQEVRRQAAGGRAGGRAWGQAGQADRTRVRNRRYAALRALQKEGQYFSEEQMRTREPLLYENYIGRFLTEDQMLERSQDAMLDGAEGGVGGGLAHLLLNSYQERLIQNRLQEEQDREDGGQEEDEEEDDDVQQEDREPSAEEKVLLREEFISHMHQNFLDGKDQDFNYREVDENPEYDNLDIVSRDAEDKYFDEDEEEEDNDMTE